MFTLAYSRIVATEGSLVSVAKIETRIKATRINAKRHHDPRYLNPCLYRYKN